MAGEKSPLAFKALPTGTFVCWPLNSRIDFPEGPWVLLAESSLLLGRSSDGSLCVQQKRSASRGRSAVPAAWAVSAVCSDHAIHDGTLQRTQVGNSKESGAGGSVVGELQCVTHPSSHPPKFPLFPLFNFSPRKPCDFICFSLHVLN